MTSDWPLEVFRHGYTNPSIHALRCKRADDDPSPPLVARAVPPPSGTQAHKIAMEMGKA